MLFDIFDILVYHNRTGYQGRIFKGCQRAMLKPLNMFVKMDKYENYCRSILEKLIRKPERGTLFGVPGFAAIAVMETGDHNGISKKIQTYQTLIPMTERRF